MNDTTPTLARRAFLDARSAHAEGNLELAEAGYRHAIELDADNADAIHLLGVLHAQRDQHEQAEALFRQAMALKDDIWAFHDNLAKSLQEQGKPQAARDAYLRAAELKPDLMDALNSAAFLSLQLDDLAGAEAILQRMLAHSPDSAVTNNNLGMVLNHLNKTTEAEAAFRRAIALNPDYTSAHFNFGVFLSKELRRAEALKAYQTALRCDPGSTKILNNLGFLYHESKNYSAAEATFQRALEIEPDHFDICMNLGGLYFDMKRYQEAVASYQRALDIAPERGNAMALLSYCKRHIFAWEGLPLLNAKLRQRLADNDDEMIEPMRLFSEPGISPQEQLRAGRRKVEDEFKAILHHPPLVSPARSTRGERLRIGYLSADFHEHATMHLMLGVLEQRDTTQIDTILYSIGPDIQDAWRERAHQACEKFVDLQSMGDHAAAQLIAADEIDILVDLKGYTEDTRLGILAWRPAPIIVSWLGYPGTLGHPRMADYLIGDPVVTPLAHQENYSETLALMPDSYQPTDCHRLIGIKPTRLVAGLPERGFVFCSFNQAFKLNPETFSVWCRLLREIPDSVLWLLEHTALARANLRAEAQARGVNPDRLVFAPLVTQYNHLGRLQLADLALDTFPYGSHTTGSDALWAGVPLISRMGDTFASRVSASLLSAAKLPELITDSWDAYYTLAKKLATDPAALRAIKQSLEDRHKTPLFNTTRFTRNLERLYQLIWQHRQSAIDTPLAALAPVVLTP